MNPRIKQRQRDNVRRASWQEILILADGRVMAHNLTPAMAALLRELNPDDAGMRQRARDLGDESSDGFCPGT